MLKLSVEYISLFSSGFSFTIPLPSCLSPPLCVCVCVCVSVCVSEVHSTQICKGVGSETLLGNECCVCACVGVYGHVCMYVRVYTSVGVCAYVGGAGVPVCVRVCMSVCACGVYACVYACGHVCMCVGACARLWVCVHVCVYVCACDCQA